jgi:hypothetical protein
VTEEQIINGVAGEIVWWRGERLKKFGKDGHKTMSVNPFLLPIIYEMHEFKTLSDIADFIIAGHFKTGYDTGFGKLMDEKILPNVFKTRKINSLERKKPPFNKSEFTEIDHIVRQNGKNILLSLKAGRWTIQLTMAKELNSTFHRLLKLNSGNKLDGFRFEEIVVGVFYGKKEDLTDKYEVIKGNSRTDHDLYEINKSVKVFTGTEFWSWINDGEAKTADWVMQGILLGNKMAAKRYGSMKPLFDEFKTRIQASFEDVLNKDGSLDYNKLGKKINS